MCRYALTNYKSHYACFSCRKTFKRKLLSDVLPAATDSVAAKCPQCQELMANMGLDFKSPAQKDEKRWQHMRNLFAAGITYHSCGCMGPGYIPASTPGLATYLSERLGSYVQELRFWLTRAQPTTKTEFECDKNKNFQHNSLIPRALTGKQGGIETAAAVAYWQERVSQVQNDLNRVKALLPKA